jgi:hypothetical protein
LITYKETQTGQYVPPRILISMYQGYKVKMLPTIRKGTRTDPIGDPCFRIAHRPTKRQSGNQTTPKTQKLMPSWRPGTVPGGGKVV